MRWMIAMLMLVLTAAPAQAMTEEEAGRLFAEANERFNEGVALLDEDPQRARSLLEGAAARYERIREGGIENGEALYNQGNALLLLGEIGPAILAYRRAEQFMPGDANLERNLATARARVASRVEDSEERAWLDAALFWRAETTARAQWRVFLVLWFGAWGAMLLWRLGLMRGRTAAWISGALFLTSGAIGAGIGLTWQERATRPAGVIIAEQVVGRTGPGEAGYEASFTSALSEGVEFAALETRGAWMHVELVDGRRTWIPAPSAALVEPGRREDS